MAKGLRSKKKRQVRTVKRSLVVKTDRQKELEEEKYVATDTALNAPVADVRGRSSADAMQTANGAEAMAIEIDPNLPELTTKNPAKLLKKLKARRLAATKGVNKAPKKKSNPLAGVNQFHRRKRK